MGKFKIYTKRGDGGKTSLYGGARVKKNSPRVIAYGAVDELNSAIGMAVVETKEIDLRNHLMEVQKDLYVVGSNLAFPGSVHQAVIDGESVAQRLPRLSEKHIERLETWIDHYEEELPELRNFILSGGTRTSAMLHVARNICRRCERDIITLKEKEEIDKTIIPYMNRLSDYLFNAARLASLREGKEDIKWMPDKTTLSEYLDDVS